MRIVSHEVGKSIEGKPMYRHQLIYDDNTNYLVKAQSYFTKEQKKIAKLNYRLNKRQALI